MWSGGRGLSCWPLPPAFLSRRTRQPELEAQVEEHRKRVAAAKKLHAAQVRRQKEFLRSIGVPDWSPEEIIERARRSSAPFRPRAFARAAERRRSEGLFDR
jgi:hypothetical protein